MSAETGVRAASTRRANPALFAPSFPTRRGKGLKAIVFMSSCDSVDFHHKLFSHAFWPKDGCTLLPPRSSTPQHLSFSITSLFTSFPLSVVPRFVYLTLFLARLVQQVGRQATAYAESGVRTFTSLVLGYALAPCPAGDKLA